MHRRGNEKGTCQSVLKLYGDKMELIAKMKRYLKNS